MDACLNKGTFRTKKVGCHVVLRGGHRIEPGIYKGIFAQKGKATAAYCTALMIRVQYDTIIGESRDVNCTPVHVIFGLAGIPGTKGRSTVSGTTTAKKDLNTLTQAVNLLASSKNQNVTEAISHY